MTVDLSPENIETIARRVVELLEAREREQQPKPPGLPRGPAAPLLPIRGYDADGRWVDIEFDSTGNPIERCREMRLHPPEPTSRHSQPANGRAQ